MVAAIAVASIQIANQTGSSNPGSVVHSAAGQRVVGPGYTPPSFINANCQQDVTGPLAHWLYSLPQGTSTKPTVVQFAPDACYEVNGSMFLRDFRYFVFNGNGATFDQAHVIVGRQINMNGGNRPAYCGSSAWQDASASDFFGYGNHGYGTIMWFVEGGCQLTFENMKFVGTNHGPGGGPLEVDTFVTFAGTQDALVNHVTMTDPYGDYVDTQGLHEAPGPVEGHFESSNITVENSSFTGAGRQGIGIVLANHVNVEYNHFYGATATLFDIEWDSTGGTQSDLMIAHNTIVGQNYGFLVSAQTGSKLQRFEFADNQLIDGAQLRIFIAPASGSEDVRVTGNTSNQPATWTWRANVTIKNVVRSEVDHNSTPVGWWKQGNGNGGPFVRAVGGLVRNNTLLGEQIYANKGTLVVQQDGTSCSDTAPGGQKLDGACSSKVSYPTVVAPGIALLPSY
jgi:Right handed beta helix region